MQRKRVLADIGERGWLEHLAERLSGAPRDCLQVPIGDDAAVLAPPQGKSLVLTSDAFIEGTHFRRSWLGWSGLARRAVLAAASDVTAMGGRPVGFLVSIGIPSRVRIDHLEAFTDGLVEVSTEFGLIPLGGDTVRSPRVMLDVMVVGEVKREEVLLQTGASPGDALWVSAALGRCQALVELKSARPRGFPNLDHPLWNPRARWPLLPALRKALPVRALTDLSDGLAVDLTKVLRRSGLGAVIHLDRLPIDPFVIEQAKELDLKPHEYAFLGGEDFELLVVEAGDSQSADRIDLDGVPLTRIGKVTSSAKGVETHLHGKQKRIRSKGFVHFA
ncbi:MAG: Thiamine-monophosphate kinase [bacterium]|nr:Thiamine-monophosphate kinase [bacterium]